MTARFRTLRILARFAVATALTASASASAANAQTAPPNSVTLQWTAPGDDGNVGLASAYELRYSSTRPAGTDSASLAAWWSQQSSAVSGLPIPSPPGQTDQAQVNGLSYQTRYFFVIRTRDEAFNWSGFSNVASDSVPPCSAPSASASLSQPAVDQGAVVLTWAATSDPLASSMKIYRANGLTGGSFTLLATIPSGQGTSYRDASVTSGSSYRYRAAWCDVCDGPAAEVSVTVGGGTSLASATTPTTLHAYPNPSTGSVQFKIDVPGSAPLAAYVRLFDLNGRTIATLVNASYDPGEHTFSWPRVSAAGTRVAPGYYVAIGTIGSVHVKERLLLLP